MKRYERSSLSALSRKLRKDQTTWEQKLWQYLRANKFEGLQFKRQVPIGKYIVDFCCQEKKLIIELDGKQHNNQIVLIKGSDREIFLESQGYKILRFWNHQLENNLTRVLEEIRRSL